MDDRLDPKRRIAGEAPIYAAAALMCALCYTLGASKGKVLGMGGPVRGQYPRTYAASTGFCVS